MHTVHLEKVFRTMERLETYGRVCEIFDISKLD